MSRLEKLGDALFLVIEAIMLVAIVGWFAASGLKLVQGDGQQNAIEESRQFGGFSSVNLETFYDRNTGVCYVISEEGYISPLYNPDGSLKTIDNYQ